MLLMALNLTQGEFCREQGPEWRKGLSSCWGCLRSWGEGTLELGWRAGDRLPQPSSALAGGVQKVGVCREWGCWQGGPGRVLRVGAGGQGWAWNWGGGVGVREGIEACFSSSQLPHGGKDNLRVELRDQGLKRFV